MNKAFLAVLLMAAASGPALAQTVAPQPNNSTTQPLPPQTDLQAEGARSQQPLNAHTVDQGPGFGQANAIPTPTFDHPMSKVPQPPKIDTQDPLR